MDACWLKEDFIYPIVTTILSYYLIRLGFEFNFWEKNGGKKVEFGNQRLVDRDIIERPPLLLNLSSI